MAYRTVPVLVTLSDLQGHLIYKTKVHQQLSCKLPKLRTSPLLYFLLPKCLVSRIEPTQIVQNVRLHLQHLTVTVTNTDFSQTISLSVFA